MYDWLNCTKNAVVPPSLEAVAVWKKGRAKGTAR